MGFLELIILSVGLAMDAFSVSIVKGLTLGRPRPTDALAMGIAFGGFQGLMPVLGWLLGSQFLWLIEPIDHWIAFALLAGIGTNMIVEAVRGGDEEQESTGRGLRLTELIMLAIATSIDALTVGIAFASLHVDIVLSCTCIGVVTFALCVLGTYLGASFGGRFERPAQIAGGIILILLGLKVLLEHLGFLG